jgi:L-2-hydroxyglutarate oxidase LhgO
LITIINRARTAYGGRYMSNVHEIESWAMVAGLRVRVVDFAGMRKAEIVALMQETTILLGMHGTRSGDCE